MGYKKHTENLLSDWFQTLINKINQMAAIIGKANFKGTANQIYVNRRMETLLMKLSYYNIYVIFK
jgi:hypothetical protein